MNETHPKLTYGESQKKSRHFLIKPQFLRKKGMFCTFMGYETIQVFLGTL